MMGSAHTNSWQPEKPASKGATAYHEAVVESSWMKDSIYEIAKVVKPIINKNDIIVDFGAGTGASALLLLKHLEDNIKLWLVDNSQSWLAKAYEVLNKRKNVAFFVLEKKGDKYATLAETVGNGAVNHVVSANTMHLIPDLKDVFLGINHALKKNGTLTFQSGDFMRDNKPEGMLMIDDTVKTVHDTALEIVEIDDRFAVYREGLRERIKSEESQRKFVFPDPRPIEFYLETLEETGFEHKEPVLVPVKIKYIDWLNFLRVKRLQAGILPEIGGREPSQKEEEDRNNLITESALRLFKDLRERNPLADDASFTVDCVCITSIKKH